MSKFIVFEGIDGSGKSTLTEELKKSIELLYVTCEPTDSEIGLLARKVAYQESSPYHELFLYLADRAEHTVRIKEKMDSGYTVLCDRYWGSTAAYQAAHGVIDMRYLVEIQMPFVLEADVTILFDLPVEDALKRISGRDDTSKYERMNFLEKVRENYLKLAQEHGWVVVDAGRELEVVKEDIRAMVKKL